MGVNAHPLSEVFRLGHRQRHRSRLCSPGVDGGALLIASASYTLNLYGESFPGGHGVPGNVLPHQWCGLLVQRCGKGKICSDVYLVNVGAVIRFEGSNTTKNNNRCQRHTDGGLGDADKFLFSALTWSTGQTSCRRGVAKLGGQLYLRACCFLAALTPFFLSFVTCSGSDCSLHPGARGQDAGRGPPCHGPIRCGWRHVPCALR